MPKTRRFIDINELKIFLFYFLIKLKLKSSDRFLDKQLNCDHEIEIGCNTTFFTLIEYNIE